jgi:hypothetical protein
MSALNENVYQLPDGVSNFSDKEKAKWNKNLEKSRARTAANVRHLVVGIGPWKRPRKKWSGVAWKQYLEGKDPTLDEILVGAAPPPGIDVADEVVPDAPEEVVLVPAEEE